MGEGLLRTTGAAAIILGLLSSPAAHAAAAQRQNLIEWLTPPAPHPTPQSAAEKDAGKAHGRALPVAELLQPTLDPSLPSYVLPKARGLAGTFRVSASDILPGLVRRWIKGFERLYPAVHLILSPPYAGSLGAKELVAGKVDVAFVSRELRPSDIAAFKARYGYPPLSVPVSGGTYRHYGFLDTVVFFVNKANPIERVTFRQLDRLFSRTHRRGGKAIMTWGELGLVGAWANRPVHLYGIKPWNGFEEFVRERVLSAHGKRGAWREDITFSGTVFPVAGQVAKDPDGIGYSGLAFIDAPVKLLPLQAKAGAPYYAPTYENVARADYPLSRLVYFNINARPGKALPPALRQFLLYILSRQGQQKVLDQAIYLPLRAKQVRASRAVVPKAVVPRAVVPK